MRNRLANGKVGKGNVGGGVNFSGGGERLI